jgi:hypothetical protein
MPTAYTLLSIAVTIAGSAWLLGALLAVKKGIWLRPIQRVVLFALPMHVAIKYVYSTEFRRASSNFVRAIPKIIGPVLVSGAILFGLIWLSEYYSSVVTLFSIGIFAVLVGIPAAIRFVKAAHSALHDRKMANVSGLGESMRVEARWLACRIQSLRSSIGVIALLRNIRSVNPKPSWDPRAIEFLRSLAAAAQSLEEAETVDEVTTITQSLCKEWHSVDLKADIRLYIFMRSDVLDEIARTDENVTAPHL